MVDLGHECLNFTGREDHGSWYSDTIILMSVEALMDDLPCYAWIDDGTFLVAAAITVDGKLIV